MNNLDNECQDCTSMYFLEPEIKVTSISAKWKISDYLGAMKMRTTLLRNTYVVAPGLYSIGNPNRDSEVLVSANYKLSFDVLRRNLMGVDAWILVLNTKGVNVWCAAGKGTFGTEELINRIEVTGILNRINHKRIIVPQLGAPGIAAHKIKDSTGLNVKYGPIRAKDIREYLNSGRKVTAEMRRVKFNMADRLILAPVEMVYSLKYFLYTILFLCVIAGFDKLSFSAENFLTKAPVYLLAIGMAFLAGTFIGPVFLPLLPFKSFSIKGAFAGALFWVISFFTLFNQSITIESVAFLLVFVVVGSFFTMNFTGASTYTSLSGVRNEMKYAIPAQISMGIICVVLFIVSIFI